MWVVDLLCAWRYIENGQRAILSFTVGELDSLIVMSIPKILGSLYHVALRAGHTHERCRESGGHGNGRNVCGRRHERRVNWSMKATIIAVSVTLEVRNESMRAVLVLGEVGDLGSGGKPRMLPGGSCTRLLPSKTGRVTQMTTGCQGTSLMITHDYATVLPRSRVGRYNTNPNPICKMITVGRVSSCLLG